MKIRFAPNTLYYGACLEMMADVPNECIDLICLDPPFNSNEAYHTIFKGPHGLRNIAPQTKAFDDMWLCSVVVSITAQTAETLLHGGKK